ncbi:MAG: (2Fe-2S) ferredoxin domain-containing protein [Nanoarchaeota archaeon]
MEEIAGVAPDLHVFVCVNDRHGEKESCGQTITEEDVVAVKAWLRETGRARNVYCTKTKCLGFCNPDGGVIAVYPEGTFIKGVRNAQDIKQIITAREP